MRDHRAEEAKVEVPAGLGRYMVNNTVLKPFLDVQDAIVALGRWDPHLLAIIQALTRSGGATFRTPMATLGIEAEGSKLPKSLHNMVFGPKSLQTCVLRALGLVMF